MQNQNIESAGPFQAHYEFRQKLVDRLREDLIGPQKSDEVITDSPLTKYIAGILYPQSNISIDPEEDSDTSNPSDDGDDTEATDSAVSLANVKYPSSAGMTFAVNLKKATQVFIDVRAGSYKPLYVEGEGATSGKPRWKRTQLACKANTLAVNVTTSGTWQKVVDGLELYCRVRPSDASGIAAVTVVLVNKNQHEPGDQLGRIQKAFFQVQMVIRGKDKASLFAERDKSAFKINDEDLESYRLIYRKNKSFAVGHGCAALWKSDGHDSAFEIEMSFVPQHDLRLSESNGDIPDDKLAIRSLALGNRADVTTALQELCDGYQKWIDACRVESSTLSSTLSATATKHLSECEIAHNRMMSGVELLRSDSTVFRAFQLANLAMLRQRSRTEWLKKRETTSPIEDLSLKWRPFQLAFILLCLKGIATSESEDRNLVDLLWFPTGGGKTEAYLGLIAFASILRRLRSRGAGAGVTALMRYTLRLLTIQQFERAALLIACCESIRRENQNILGNQPFSIGLWVGRAATPNSRDDCRKALQALRRNQTPEEGNPIQLHKCIWCGSALNHRNYWQRPNGELVIACGAEGCTFENGLPAYVVDDDIYQCQPTLLIGTVDKFAGLPWNDKTAALFNADNPSFPAPELIIQDELHLISGPLGTLTGLYETAVDALCSIKGVPPKIIASTATIRRAQAQTQALFAREAKQFPPAALTASDSYFAVEGNPQLRATRLYVGLMAPGSSQSTLMIRVYACLLQAVKDIPGPPEVKDTFWTLLGYYNSLRILGAAKLQVQDDVSDRIAYLQPDQSKRRVLEHVEELTSRIESTDIGKILTEMSVRYPNPEVRDVILATNMISVGVDVDRLSLMAVMGQPQSTAEYIQSTSRVGRRTPGLVFAMFNASRSRDRSHYENFVAYHSALYRQVEPTSVTPFSPRSRDRGLHAVLVALARLSGLTYRPNNSASDVKHLEANLTAAKNIILSRANKVLGDGSLELSTTERELDELIQRWKQEGEDRSNLMFQNMTDVKSALLVEAFEERPSCVNKFKTLRSLRDVDKNSELYEVRQR